MTVYFCPQNLKTMSIISDICFLASVRFIKSKVIFVFFGSILANKNLPAVLVYFLKTVLLFSSKVLNLDTIVE